ncbi:MAG: peptidoglycan-binding protein, partial [gamma proteobacterium endosymbiont of Lamellibrachia anaximandri]|nr:peptidoglycan-binding protein [gamma proteobacterium endosymbiont of Lamellibrachia anaximandri]
MDDLIDAIPIPGGGANTQTQPQHQDITRYQQRSAQYQRDTSTRLTDRQSVADAQRMLSRLGYNVGVVDGIYGKKTSNAIKSFQRSRGTSSDGFVTLGLLDELTDATNGVRSSDNVSDSQELANAQKKDKQQATFIGAVGGAIAGTVLAEKFGLRAAEKNNYPVWGCGAILMNQCSRSVVRSSRDSISSMAL